MLASLLHSGHIQRLAFLRSYDGLAAFHVNLGHVAFGEVILAETQCPRTLRRPKSHVKAAIIACYLPRDR